MVWPRSRTSGIPSTMTEQLRHPPQLWGGLVLVLGGLCNPAMLLFPRFRADILTGDFGDLGFFLLFYTLPCLLMAALALRLLRRGQSWIGATMTGFAITCALATLAFGGASEILELLNGHATVYDILLLPLTVLRSAVIVIPIALFYAATVGIPAAIACALVLRIAVTRTAPKPN